MVAKREQHMRSMKNASTVSITDASDAYLESPGRNTHTYAHTHTHTKRTCRHPQQRRLCWLDQVCRMVDGCIPKDVLCGELASGARRVGRPVLRFRDAYTRDIKSAQISIESRESAAANRSNW